MIDPGLAVALRQFSCLRCHYKWWPKRGAHAKTCARCKSALWNKPKVYSCGPKPRRRWKPAPEILPPCPTDKRYSTNPLVIATRVRRLKSKLKLRWREMADLFGVSLVTVQRWGAGRCAPQLRHQRRLEELEAEAFSAPQLRQQARQSPAQTASA